MANIVQRTINDWFSRLLDAASERTFSGQDERHAPNRAKRDYVWNTIGLGIWGMVFPILTIVVTQLVGVEKAGMFSLAFIVGLLLYFIASYGVRTYQVSDLEEEHSFSDYQIHRLATGATMLVIGILYCAIRGYSAEMFAISMGVFLFRMIDGLGDVYEGRLQQIGKLYLAGISQTLRSVLVLVIFSICLLITRDLSISCIAMAVAATISFLLLTLPLALLETPKSRRHSRNSIAFLFKQCFPLFIALFVFNLIDSMPRFVMEATLGYDNQLYFNALYFPSQAILLAIQFIYRPQLVRFANLWADRSKRKRFDLMILAVTGVIFLLTLVMILIMNSFGLSVMSFLYGLDFTQFAELCTIMLITGGVIAGIDFLYQMITVLRQHRSAMTPYLITLVFSLLVPLLLVNLAGLSGIISAYLIVMCILFVLLIWQYLRIRRNFARESDPFKEDRARHSRREDLAAERKKRERMQRRANNVDAKRERREKQSESTAEKRRRRRLNDAGEKHERRRFK